MLAIYFEIKNVDGTVADNLPKLYSTIHNYLTKTLKGKKIDPKTRLFFVDTKVSPQEIIAALRAISSDVRAFITIVDSYIGYMPDEFWEQFPKN